jgi:hypothetical protein
MIWFAWRTSFKMPLYFNAFGKKCICERTVPISLHWKYKKNKLVSYFVHYLNIRKKKSSKLPLYCIGGGGGGAKKKKRGKFF